MAKNNIWDQFDEDVDTESLAADVAEAAANGRGTYKEVPHGRYEVAIVKMEPTTSKKGDAMVSIWFKIVSEGEYKGSLIFFNQVITRGIQIHIVNQLLSAMDTGVAIEFKTHKQYGEMLMDVFEVVDGNLEFGLTYGKSKKGFSTFEITEVFEVG